MSSVKILGCEYANEIYGIISEYQKQLQDKAQLNWNHESIIEILKSDKVIGIVSQSKVKDFSVDLLAFLIYKDLSNIAEVLLLGTKFDSQSRGLMKALFAFLKENYSEIWLEVHELNTKAYQFYQKENFKLDGVRPKYYTDGSSALVMSWKRGLAIC